MAHRDAPPPALPLPDQTQFTSLIRHAADVVLLLSSDFIITDVSQADGQSASYPQDWIGRRLIDLLGPESVTKLDALLAHDATIPGKNARWRHLNLSDGAGGSVPLLLKYAGLRGEGSGGGILLGRDLRPTVELQDRFRRSSLELETRLESLIAASHPPAANTNGNGNGHGLAIGARRMGDSIVADMIAKLGRKPLDGIVAETSRVLERLCVTEALERAHGNRDDAARLLGISVEDLHISLLN